MLHSCIFNAPFLALNLTRVEQPVEAGSSMIYTVYLSQCDKSI